MAGLVTLFLTVIFYVYEVFERIALFFERVTRFFIRGPMLAWVLPALIAAVALGQYLSLHPEFSKAHTALQFGNEWAKFLFLRGLGLCLPPLIFSSIYQNVRENQKEGAMPIMASAFFFLTTLSAISFGYLAAYVTGAGEGLVVQAAEARSASGGGTWLPWSSNLLAHVIAAVLLAFVLTRHDEEAAAFADKLLAKVNDWTMWWLGFMLRFIAPAVFLMLGGAIAQTDGGVMTLVGPLGRVFAGSVLGMFMHCMAIFILVCLLVGFVRERRFLWHVKGPLLNTFILRSSVGALKFNEPALIEFGIGKKYVKFVLPFGATVNMDGTSVYLTVTAVAFLSVIGAPLSTAVYVTLVLAILSASVGTAAAPSASLVLMTTVMSQAALAAGTQKSPAELEGLIAGMISLLLAVDPILDMFRTATNVFGDMHCAHVLDKLEIGAQEAQSNEVAASTES